MIGFKLALVDERVESRQNIQRRREGRLWVGGGGVQLRTIDNGTNSVATFFISVSIARTRAGPGPDLFKCLQFFTPRPTNIPPSPLKFNFSNVVPTWPRGGGGGGGGGCHTSSSELPQLAVLAKILCLLMVVMCGAVPAMVRSVSLYSTCSSGNVTVMGRSIKAVGRSDDNAPYQKLTTQSEDFSRKLYIFAEKSQRYICFNKRWKLVGLPKKQKGPMCQFYEVYNGSYLRYRSVADSTRYLGFNKLGKPMKNPHGRQECFNFIKYNPHADINHHNSLVNADMGGFQIFIKTIRSERVMVVEEQEVEMEEEEVEVEEVEEKNDHEGSLLTSSISGVTLARTQQSLAFKCQALCSPSFQLEDYTLWMIARLWMLLKHVARLSVSRLKFTSKKEDEEEEEEVGASWHLDQVCKGIFDDPPSSPTPPPSPLFLPES
ncbi:hypothetical protein M0804_010377 [Polistes exclamans]|nr:hypothetical protein M0804_010377 [Polistes exclamans]